MNYEEAKKLAQAWTKDHDVELDGWRSVIAVLLSRTTHLEAHNENLTATVRRLQNENEALSLDLGLRNK